MIDKLTYEEVHNISLELRKEAMTVFNLAAKRNIQELKDFAATVEGYTKFLESTIEMNRAADSALRELKESL